MHCDLRPSDAMSFFLRLNWQAHIKFELSRSAITFTADYLRYAVRLTGLKVGENYLRAERNTWHMFKVTWSHIAMAITPPRIVLFRSNLI